MSLKVIGAGLGRTGTHSLKLALEELGFGRCYHMDVLLLEKPEDLPFWQDLKDGKPADWDGFFTGFQSAVDMPAFLHYKEFMQRYPDAKVILSVRDAEGWYKSFGDTIIKKSHPSFGEMMATMVRLPFNKKLRMRLKVLKFAGAYLNGFFPKGFKDKESVINFYNNWNESVKNSVPQDKLLVYNAKDGWEPLCSFLNVPIPEKAFPHSNTTSEFIGRKL